MFEKIKRNKIIAVIKSDSYENSFKFASACIEGGIKNIEIITTSPGAKRLIREFSEIDEICIGAGTVLDKTVAVEAIECGAKFIVCPHTDPDIINVCKDNNVAVFAGAFTSSEIVNTWKLGVDMVKIFPSSLMGPKYIKAIKEPLPFVEIFVTGGVNLENFYDYIHCGASCVGLSSALLGVSRSVNYHEIVENSKKFCEKAKEL